MSEEKKKVSKSVKKKLMAKRLNEILGFKENPVAFEKLPYEDLLRLYEKLGNPTKFAREILIEETKGKIEGVLDMFRETTGIGKGALIKKFLSKLEGVEKK